MANREINMQRIMTKGMIAEAGIEQEAKGYYEQIKTIIDSAKNTGEKEHGAAIMAITLISLDLAEKSGV
jgi:hypothetical protein